MHGKAKQETNKKTHRRQKKEDNRATVCSDRVTPRNEFSRASHVFVNITNLPLIPNMNALKFAAATT